MHTELQIGMIVEVKKQHPCGANKWEIIRTGMDIKIRCQGCGRIVMLPRTQFNKMVRKISKD